MGSATLGTGCTEKRRPPTAAHLLVEEETGLGGEAIAFMAMLPPLSPK